MNKKTKGKFKNDQERMLYLTKHFEELSSRVKKQK